LIWKAKKCGNYFVCSAYRIYVNNIAYKSYLLLPGWWNWIWKLKVPPKIKNITWHVCRYCFPTRACLSSRGVHFPLDCVLCGNNFEDRIYALLECPRAIQAWRNGSIK